MTHAAALPARITPSPRGASGEASSEPSASTGFLENQIPAKPESVAASAPACSVQTQRPWCCTTQGRAPRGGSSQSQGEVDLSLRSLSTLGRWELEEHIPSQAGGRRPGPRQPPRAEVVINMQTATCAKGLRALQHFAQRVMRGTHSWQRTDTMQNSMDANRLRGGREGGESPRIGD